MDVSLVFFKLLFLFEPLAAFFALEGKQEIYNSVPCPVLLGSVNVFMQVRVNHGTKLCTLALIRFEDFPSGASCPKNPEHYNMARNQIEALPRKTIYGRCPKCKTKSQLEVVSGNPGREKFRCNQC